MAKKSKLLNALDRYKGVDHQLERQKKLQKDAEKRKQSKEAGIEDVEEDTKKSDRGKNKSKAKRTPSNKIMSNGLVNGNNEHQKVDMNGAEDGLEDEEWETEDDDQDEENEDDKMWDISQLNDSLSSSEDEINTNEHRSETSNGVKLRPRLGRTGPTTDVTMANAEDGDDDIPLSDLDSLASEDKGDLLPHQRLTINHTIALDSALESIALPLSSLHFSEHQSITSATPVNIPDINDDLNRELAFYSQSLAAAQEARKRLLAEGVAFSRPTDYFAEMVKSDEHMGRVKQKLVDAAAIKRAAAEARKQRDLRKFGKQVQQAKLQERAKEKREMLDKVNLLKRKRKGLDPATEAENDPFDVAIDNAARDSKSDAYNRRKSQNKGANGPSVKRQRKDEKYGFGGKKRHAKSGDAISSADMRSFPGRRMKYGDDEGFNKRTGRGAKGGRGKGADRGKGKARPGKSKRLKAKL